MAFQQAVEIFRTEVFQPLVLKVQIKDLIPFVSFSQQLLDSVKEHIGFPGSSYTDKNITRKVIEPQVSWEHHIALNFILVVTKDLFQ